MAEKEKVEEEHLTIKAKMSRELGYMKKGAKLLPRVVAKKGKKWLKGQIQAARERAKADEAMRKKVAAAERAAYEAEAVLQAKARGKARAKRGVRPFGVAEILGFEGLSEKAKPKPLREDLLGLGEIDTGSYLMSGLRKKKKA